MSKVLSCKFLKVMCMMSMGIIILGLTTGFQGVILSPRVASSHLRGARMTMMAPMSHQVRKTKLGIVRGDQWLQRE